MQPACRPAKSTPYVKTHSGKHAKGSILLRSPVTGLNFSRYTVVTVSLTIQRVTGALLCSTHAS
jgi:hypothetical protein